MYQLFLVSGHVPMARVKTKLQGRTVQRENPHEFPWLAEELFAIVIIISIVVLQIQNYACSLELKKYAFKNAPGVY